MPYRFSGEERISFRHPGALKKPEIVVLLPILVLFILGLFFWKAEAGPIPVVGEGAGAIYGQLPPGWRPMTSEELAFFEKNGAAIPLQQGKLITGFLPHEGEALAIGPFILVFEAKSEKPVQQEQFQKIYSWFERGRELVEALPAAITGMVIEDIEYLPGTATIHFKSAIKMAGDDFACFSSIIFLRDGYLNIIGLSRRNAETDLKELDAFANSIIIPEIRRFRNKQNHEAIFTWVVVNWQRVLGFTLLFSVFAVVFVRRRCD
jgi:hypothetical protein